MSKMFKLLILIIICVLYCIDLLTMNENGNGIISRRIIGTLFLNVIYVLKKIYNFLPVNYKDKISDKVFLKMYKIGCNLDNYKSCNLNAEFSPLNNHKKRLQYYKKALELSPEGETKEAIKYNLYFQYYYSKKYEKANSILKSIISKEEIITIKLYLNLIEYNTKKMKDNIILYSRNNDFKNFNHKFIYIFTILFNALLNENNNKTESKKYYDILIDNLTENENKILITYKTHKHDFNIGKLILARIYFYGFSSKGIDYEKASKYINNIDENDKLQFKNEFWNNEYDKIKNFKE